MAWKDTKYKHLAIFFSLINFPASGNPQPKVPLKGFGFFSAKNYCYVDFPSSFPQNYLQSQAALHCLQGWILFLPVSYTENHLCVWPSKKTSHNCYYCLCRCCVSDTGLSLPSVLGQCIFPHPSHSLFEMVPVKEHRLLSPVKQGACM